MSNLAAQMAPIIGWAASILSAVIVTAASAQINRRFKIDEEQRAERREESKARREDERAWRDELMDRIGCQDEKLTALNEATQTTMRTQLIHYAEKYLVRGWLTPEERKSWCDMHDKYSDLDANGFIGGYRRKLDDLPDKVI